MSKIEGVQEERGADRTERMYGVVSASYLPGAGNIW